MSHFCWLYTNESPTGLNYSPNCAKPWPPGPASIVEKGNAPLCGYTRVDPCGFIYVYLCTIRCNIIYIFAADMCISIYTYIYIYISVYIIIYRATICKPYKRVIHGMVQKVGSTWPHRPIFVSPMQSLKLGLQKLNISSNK